jgi:cell division topological specificity factor
MAGWLEWLTGQKNKSAGQAKERLKLVLINDRIDMSTEELEALKNELLEVISRHISIDPTAVSITMNQEGREQRLLADIPLQPVGRKRK